MGFFTELLPLLLGILAVLIAVFARRSQGQTVDLDDFDDVFAEGEFVLDNTAVFTEKIVPAAITIVKAMRQFYLNGELELDQLKPKALEHLRTLFPDASEEQLGVAVESAVFGVKMVAGELWRRLPRDGDEGENVVTTDAITVPDEPLVVGGDNLDTRYSFNMPGSLP